MRYLLCTTAIALSAVFAAPAHAAPLTQNAADRAANRAMTHDVTEWNAEADLYTITHAEIDPCEVLTARRAECAFTYTYEDGDVCDGIATLERGRRGKLGARFVITVCDSDAAIED